MKEFTVTKNDAGQRLDRFCAKNAPALPSSALQKYFRTKDIKVGGHWQRPDYRLAEGETVRMYVPDTAFTAPKVRLSPDSLAASSGALDVVYEDGDVIVVNKPRGMVVHPAPGHPDGTLVNALLHYCGSSLSGVGGEKRPGIVHRIDKDTSGLIIAAKNDFAHLALSAQLADRSLSRVYEAVVRGGMRQDSGTVDAPIGRHPTDRKRMAVTEKNSRNAVTHWEVVARYRGYTHVRCRLETGRTHQIRVHMAHIGHPLLGDGLYGAPCPEKGLEGQCLHAAQLKFVHPRSGECVHLSAPLPEYFLNVLSRLGAETE